MKCKKGWEHLLRVVVCVSLEQLGEAAQRAKAVLFLEKLFGRVLAGLRGGRRCCYLQSAGGNGCV